MTTVLDQLQEIMDKTGYGNLTRGKTLPEVIAEINGQLLPVDDIDPTESWELVRYELKDEFFNRHWISIDTFISDEHLEQLYNLLCAYKRETAPTKCPKILSCQV